MDTESVEEELAMDNKDLSPFAEEDLSMDNKDLSPIAKGKRTKRHRPHSPEYEATTNHTSSGESTTTEEEDTAKCLILLSQGHFETATVPFMYACKTCNRVFTSFQALGGHRASHKKPQIEKKPKIFPDAEDKKRMPQSCIRFASISAANATATAAAGGGLRPLPSPRTHECTYCRAEFTSGQALGGHMRRHRAKPTAIAYIEEGGIPLDLNLPAPENQNQPQRDIVLYNTIDRS